MFSSISPPKKNRSLPTVLLCALTSDFTGGCPPPPSRSLCQRVNLQLQFLKFLDSLMEQLISDIEPPRDLVFDDLARDLREGRVVPVLMGSATQGHGVTRILKAVRHEAPAISQTRRRLGVEDNGPALGQVIRTIHTAHGGKLSLARVLRGGFADGATVVNARGAEERIGGLARLMGAASAKMSRAEEGDTVAFARLDGLATGDRFADGRTAPAEAELPAPPPATQGVAIHVKDRKDEVRLAAALAKLCEEDRALSFVQDAEMSELKLFGQGEMHLRVTGERLADRFGVTITTQKPTVAYRETIRDAVTARGAKDLRSPNGCTAARCRGSIFLPSKPAPRTRWRAGRLDSPWSISR